MKLATLGLLACLTVAQDAPLVIPDTPATITIRVVVNGNAVTWEVPAGGRETLTRATAIKQVQGATPQEQILALIRAAVQDLARQANYAPAAARAKLAEADAARRAARAASLIE